MLKSARKQPKELTAHGDTRVDDYYWMRLSDEQKNSDNPDSQTAEVLEYLESENEYTASMLDESKDLQESLFNEIVGRIKQDDDTVPYKKNGYWYYTRYDRGREYPIYCRKKDNLGNDEEIILDVNELAKGHEYFHVAGLSISPDNTKLAFGEDSVSRRMYTIRIKDLTTGEFLTDQPANTTGSAVWTADNSTLFYTMKNRETLLSERIVRHTIGADPDSDATVYTETDTSYYIGVTKSKSRKFIIIYAQSTLSTNYMILPSDDANGEFIPFSPREQIHEYDIDHVGDVFIIKTNWNSKNFRLMQTDENKTHKQNWQEVVPHRTDVLLEGFEVFKDHLVLQERKNGLIQLQVMDRGYSSLYYVEFEETAYLAGMTANVEVDTVNLRFYYSSLTTPLTTFDYNLDSQHKTLLKREEVIGGHNPDEYTTERLLAPARDGKSIPVSLVYKHGVYKGEPVPLLLYGYGSYGVTIDPSFRSERLSLLDRGFIFAIAHIRGSQTLGREWYDDGKMRKKKNTFYDFIDCAEFLKSKGYTSSESLYAMGGSAGGLLMGAVLNLRPDLFNGVIAGVPFVDVVTTMSDPTIPLTTNEYDEWGNPADPEDYAYIKSYSPYDNVRETEYPNILVTTGLFDSQVQYWEPAKWVAKLRNNKTDANLLLLHTNMESGHGGASGRFKRHRETALQYSFLLTLAERMKPIRS